MFAREALLDFLQEAILSWTVLVGGHISLILTYYVYLWVGENIFP